MYDKNCGGTIDPNELKGVVGGLYSMLGIEVPKETIAQQAKEMLDIIDVDGDGEISKEEFIKKAETCDFICNALQVING